MNKISIATKGWILLALSLSALLLMSLASWTFTRDAIIHERKQMLTDIVDMAYRIIEENHAAWQRGEMSEAEAKKAAIEALRPFRYSQNGYIFVYKGSTPILAPDNPAKEGRDLGDIRDAKGFPIAREMIKMTANGSAGFLSYFWHHPGKTNNAVEKLSYARGFEPWDWYIGTGIYQDDIQNIYAGLLKRNAWILAATAVMLAVFVALGFLLAIGSIKRLFRLKKELLYLSKGHLTRKIAIDGSDELAQMATSITEVQQHLHDVASDLDKVSSLLLDGISDIATENRALSVCTAKQSENLSGINETLQRIASVTRSNNEAIIRAASTAGASKAASHAGERLVQETIAAMEKINHSSSRISEIIGVIDDLAFQTNLLALNAAVEAARAGEAGSGFAVVANEVRNLAQRSADAARQIRDLIEESAKNVQAGSELVARSGETLDQIVNNFGNVADQLEAVSKAASAQTRDIEKTSELVNDLSILMQQSLGRFSATAEASAALRRTALDMRKRVAFFRMTPAEPKPATERAQGIDATDSHHHRDAA